MTQSINFDPTDTEARKHSIGGSDAGAVLGVNPYRTPIDVFFEKTGRREPEDLSDNPLVHWGIKLEDLVANEFSERTQIKVRRSNITHYHPQYAFMTAHVDRFQVGNKRILEVKTGSIFSKDWGEENTDEVLGYHLIQGYHYLACLPNQVGLDYAVFLGGCDFRTYSIERDPEMIQMIEEGENQFWNEYILQDKCPPPISEADVKQIYSQSNGETIVADHKTMTEINLLRDVKRKLKELEAEEKRLKTQIQIYMGNHAFLSDSEGLRLASFKNSQTKRFQAKTFQKANPSLYQEFLQTTDTRTLRLAKEES